MSVHAARCTSPAEIRGRGLNLLNRPCRAVRTTVSCMCSTGKECAKPGSEEPSMQDWVIIGLSNHGEPVYVHLYQQNAGTIERVRNVSGNPFDGKWPNHGPLLTQVHRGHPQLAIVTWTSHYSLCSPCMFTNHPVPTRISRFQCS